MVNTALATCGATAATAASFDVPSGDLNAALDAYIAQSGVQLLVPNASVRGIYTKGARGNLSDSEALSRILKGTGFIAKPDSSGIVGIVHEAHSDTTITPITLAQASPPSRAAVETVTVTSSKLGGADVQSIPIAITALSQEQLTATQTAGGPDLVKQVPNMTFTKTNFSGYSIQLRGIGTQAISVTTDPAVAVAFNDIPFIRNHFFEQEFYDVAEVEVLRGPQGTLYGRNATAGVVNLTSAKPSDQFESMLSAEIGSYHQRRFEAMINVPIIDDRLDIRVAGEWTKRQGYSLNATSGDRIDGRDLWSGRLTIGWKPLSALQAYFVWEHFSEDDDRMRSSKQLCKKDPGPAELGGVSLGSGLANAYLSQGCLPVSLYTSDAFEVPNGFALPYYGPLASIGIPVNGNLDPYASTTQSTNLRIIESTIDPHYKAKNDVIEFNAEYKVSSVLNLVNQTAFNHDFLWSTEDYNRFNTQPGVFLPAQFRGGTWVSQTGVFCDPQLGCSDRLVAQDLSAEHAWQLSHEARLESDFGGPFNFSMGGNYLHYETEENYYVFINSLTLWAAGAAGNPDPWVPGVSDNHECLKGGFIFIDPTKGSETLGTCKYIDPNPINQLNNNGHNYFLSQNPYNLNSYAAFGEMNYQVSSSLKLTAGLRWTEDQKHFTDIPSELVTQGWGYGISGALNQQWDEFTGRVVANWSPKLSFTDQTLIYWSYAHGYKAGGANPPGAVLLTYNTFDDGNPIHPLTFKPEFVDAFELGSKNTLLDGGLTINADVFYYNYENYQISRIVDRTSINDNFDAHIKGAELEAMWEPVPGLRFNFGGGYEDARVAKGSKSVDLMDRTAGHSDWAVVRPFPGQASNCILPVYVILTPGGANCGPAYFKHQDPVTQLPYVPNPTIGADQGGLQFPLDLPGYIGFDPYTAPNNGQGFDKSLGGNELPNAPPLTVSAGGQYSIPLTTNWAGTLRGDYYWQDYSWARVFNDNPYDRLRGYTNLNITLILTSQSGWQVMLYDKNVFNTTAITGTFLNSDDSDLTTNVFLTDPKLIGVRVTKNW